MATFAFIPSSHPWYYENSHKGADKVLPLDASQIFLPGRMEATDAAYEETKVFSIVSR